jgi:hypothetical protein
MPGWRRHPHTAYILCKEKIARKWAIEKKDKFVFGVHANNTRKGFVAIPTDTLHASFQKQARVNRNAHLTSK